MKKVTIYFIGGTDVEFTKCDTKCVENLKKWLENDDFKTFKINGVNEGRETILRKDVILFIDIN